MMRTAAILAGLLLAGTSFAAEPEGNGYPCYRAPSAPVIDGEVKGDPAWQAIPVVTGFRVLGDGYTQAKQTTAQACWDDQAICIAIVCEEPDAAQLKPTARDFGYTWGEDSVEIFLQPNPRGDAYQFGVTAGGAKGSGNGNPDVAKCQAAAQIGPDCYSLELRIPFGVLNTKPPTAGEKWLGTFCRNIFTTASGGDKFTNWAPLQRQFLEPEDYLPILFTGETLTPAQAAERTEQLNASYRSDLIAELHKAAMHGDVYTKDLAEATKDGRFADQARDLLHQWQEVERVNREADKAPLPDIRKAIRTVTALGKTSYDVKYKYLITKLFEGE